MKVSKREWTKQRRESFQTKSERCNEPNDGKIATAVPKPVMNKLLCLIVKANIRKEGLEFVKGKQEMSDDRSMSEEVHRVVCG